MDHQDDRTTKITENHIDGYIGDPVAKRQSIPTLTLVYHRDLTRLGQRARLSELLAGRDTPVSRNTPFFAATRQSPSGPLEDVYLSRTPFFVRATGQGLAIDPAGSRIQLSVEGEPLRDTRVLTGDELERGVLIELGSRVALLLQLQQPHQERGDSDFGLVGNSVAICQLRDRIRQLANDDATVLIRGETGVGKELVAQALHHQSCRRERDLVSVNMATLRASTAMVSLFGARRGAFTGAENQAGYFRRAHRGTLFLDEIGEADPEVQTMLLRVIETGQLEPLGGQPQPVDVRLISATDADLSALMAEGRFDNALLHRLAGHEISIPPVRERRSDIAPLLVHFLRAKLTKLGRIELLETSPQKPPWLSLPVVSHFLRRDWPGNVRQLANAANRLVLANLENTTAVLPRDWLGRAPVPAVRCQVRRRRKPTDLTDQEVVQAMRQARGEIKKAARLLDISRGSLYTLIDRSHVLRRVEDIPEDELRQCYQLHAGDLDSMSETFLINRSVLKKRLQKLGVAQTRKSWRFNRGRRPLSDH